MRKRVGKVLSAVVLIIVAIIIILLILFNTVWSKSIFHYETYINGTDVSFLSAEGASQKLERINNTTIQLIFADDKTYSCVGAYFEFQIEDIKIIEELIKTQRKDENENKVFKDIELYTVNEGKIKEYLQSLSVFNTNNMREPVNAYLDFDSNNHVVIKPEVYGNQIDLEQACNYMIQALKKGNTTIDFREITNINPKILASDKKLIEQRDNINTILSTTIHYNISKKTTYTLDATIMKEWVYRGDDGYYGIDIDSNVAKFVEELNNKATYIIPSTSFSATGLGTIQISFGRKTYATVNQDEEIRRIKENLGTSKVLEWEPIYNPKPDYTNLSTYVEVDISRQRVWMYVNGTCILNTPCVTGSVAGGHSTPVGIYHLTYKTRNTYLTDGKTYNSFVNFWMPFNGGIGFHDADGWRSSYGGNIYLTNGSHGCINLPYWAAQTLYQNINTSIPIILYS